MQRVFYLFLLMFFANLLISRVLGPSTQPIFHLILVTSVVVLTIIALRMHALRTKIFRHYIAEASRFLKAKIESHRGMISGEQKVVRGFYKGREVRLGVCLAPGFFERWSCPIRIRIVPHRKKMKKFDFDSSAQPTPNTYLSRGVIHYRDTGFNSLWGWGGLCETFSESKLIEVLDELTRAAEILEGATRVQES